MPLEEHPARGVPCCVMGQELRSTEEWGSRYLAQLLFAEVSYATLQAQPYQDALLIAIAPAICQAGLRGIFATKPEDPEDCSVLCWFVVMPSMEQQQEILETLSMAGCVRYDMEEDQNDDKYIGAGACSTVWIMRQNGGGPCRAAKTLKIDVDPGLVEREVMTLRTVQGHPNIVSFYGLFCSPDVARITLVFQFAPVGDILRRSQQTPTLTEDTARPLLRGLMSALAFVHQRQIVHRDVKAENVLLLREDIPLLGDFGLATQISDASQMARRCGTPGYVAPEVCKGMPYGVKVDVFGAGVVLFVMLSGDLPFASSDHSTVAIMRKTASCKLHLHQPPWSNMSRALRSCLRGMLTKGHAERLSSAESLAIPWLA